MNSLEPDREMLGQFALLMFKHARHDGFVSLRAFPDKKTQKKDKPIFIDPIRIDDVDFLATTTERARQAAAWHEPAVFCPPVVTFRNHKNAKTENIFEGVCLSVECDQNPHTARATLEALLGTTTAVVASGGEWINPQTGEIEPKVHLYWRLKKPTITKLEHDLLKEARALATKLVGGDDTNISIVHPIRWPGSWHRKGTPRLAETVAFSDDNEIDLAEAVERLRDAAGALDFSKAGVNANGELEADDHAAVAAALAVIPNNRLEWNDWNRIGMATWAATGGSEAGRAAFHAWSANDKKKYNKATTDARWDHYFNSPPTEIGFGTLVYLARQHSPGWTCGSGGVPNEQQEESNDLARLNESYAVLPIGGKTRVVKFGEMDEFPGRKTVVMTQTLADFAALNNKYRHVYLDKGELQTIPMGTYWVQNQKRRQYDGGMAFMPYCEGDVRDKLNLWHGFGVKPIKTNMGCGKFLDFARDIICSGNTEHFDYLIKREAFIIQKRTRSEVALGLQTKEEGCGKGFYEKSMRRLLGNHAMQLQKSEHIIGKFNPHLETLLRLTADEALFVGDPKHRNALFGLITEPTMEIEPKNLGVYIAPSFLNMTILSNSEHFIPVSETSRPFFVPTVSNARRENFDYFAGLQDELDNGGYEALLYHLLHEVDLEGFNVRKVPQTEALKQQRDQSLPPLEAWWIELLQTGTLWGADPNEPHKAVSNRYQREVLINEGERTFVRYVNQPGVFDQAREIEPRLRNFTNQHLLGRFLSQMGCNNNRKVLRRQGWAFPPLKECRAKWEVAYPGWAWRNPEITEWQAEEDDESAALK